MSHTGAVSRLLALLSLCLLLSKPALTDTVTGVPCSEIVKAVAPCLNYVLGKSNEPSANCCAGVKKAYEGIKSKADKQAACNCLKASLSKLTYDPNRISALPKKCHYSFTIPPVSSKFNCANV
ncbi:non-specific lipid-transfer protein A-like [Mercurialis annua]|uniref:non-specific lipid-transfer protein A-like n=1 Tax=Mercurialis annua TaxID=3986 RepID=UPI00216053FB|nr:non-specific lipid-transfer protein A-like [Mercurialis annua]